MEAMLFATLAGSGLVGAFQVLPSTKKAFSNRPPPSALYAVSRHKDESVFNFPDAQSSDAAPYEGTNKVSLFPSLIRDQNSLKGLVSAFVRHISANVSVDWLNIQAARPCDVSNNKSGRTKGEGGMHAWYDPTHAAKSLINLRTASPERQLNKVTSFAARIGTKWRGDEIGVNWDDEIRRWDAVHDELEACYRDILDPTVEYPAYYLEPFHAYDDGNLSWLAAKEYEAASITVFSDLFNDNLELAGDPQFRDAFLQASKVMHMGLLGKPLKPKTIVDIGCGVGLSTRRYAREFPEAKVLGIDLSPHFVAIAQHRLKENPLSNMEFRHAKGEDTKLPSNSVDVVSLTTVVHELPRSAAKAIFLEAKRILKPNGILSFVDMDPTDQFMSYMNGYGGLFKAGIAATEPHLIEYISIDFPDLLKECGFASVQRKRVTTRHCAYTAALLQEDGTDDFDDPNQGDMPKTRHSGFDFVCPIRNQVLEKRGVRRYFNAGDVISSQRTTSDVVYKVLSGTCRMKGSGGKQFRAGDVINESTFWLNKAQPSEQQEEVIALSPVLLLELTKSTVESVLSETEVTRSKLKFLADDANTSRTELEKLQSAVTAPCSVDSLKRFVRHAKVVTHKAGTKIVQADEAPGYTFVVKSGECYSEIDNRRRLHYTTGDYFGTKCATVGPDNERSASVMAETDVEVWQLIDTEFDALKEIVYTAQEKWFVH